MISSHIEVLVGPRVWCLRYPGIGASGGCGFGLRPLRFADI